MLNAAATEAIPARARLPWRGRKQGARRVRVPADTVLTVRTLLGAGRKLADAELGDPIEGLVEELNARVNDPDREPAHWDDEPAEWF